MLDTQFIFIIFIIILALLFDFYNGMNDAANSIATVVSTKVLSPKLAVAWAAFFNFAAAFIFSVHVAMTIGKGIIDTSIVNEYVVFASLIGAITWTVIATHWGIPISVSHALIGGMIGVALVKAGPGALVFSGIFKIILFIFLSPIIGFLLSIIFIIITTWIVYKYPPFKVDNYFRVFQLFSAGAFSLGHGTNDAQKTMGIIAMLLYTSGHLGDKFYIPWWVIFACYFFISMGTLVGGWKVIKTLGINVTKLKPIDGFCAETASAATLLFTALSGIPVSTTHTITGAIIGVGSTKRLSAIRWDIAGKIITAWIITMPFAAIVSAFIYLILKIFI